MSIKDFQLDEEATQLVGEMQNFKDKQDFEAKAVQYLKDSYDVGISLSNVKQTDILFNGDEFWIETSKLSDDEIEGKQLKVYIADIVYSQ